MAAVIIQSLERVKRFNITQNAQLSLTRTALLLMQHAQSEGQIISSETKLTDYTDVIESAPWRQSLQA